MWPRRQIGCAVVALAMAASTQSSARAESSVELPGSVVQFPRLEQITLERIDLQIGLEAVRVTYSLRNVSKDAQAFLATITLPDLDMMSLVGEDVRLPVPADSNFTDLVVSIDGVLVVPALDQRAMALGLDVTRLLFDNAIPLFPFAHGIGERFGALSPDTRKMLGERGVTLVDRNMTKPAWTLKSTFHWPMRIAPGATVVISIAYRPIAGSRRFDVGDVEKFASAYCAAPFMQSILQKRIAGGQTPQFFKSVLLTVPWSAGQIGPAGRLRITVLIPDEKVLASTCREGFRRTGPLTLEWEGPDAALEEDLSVAFVR